MIKIKQSKTADTRSCDYTKVDKQTLLVSSLQHMDDVKKGLEFFKEMLSESASNHDFDKITDLDSFHSDFILRAEDPSLQGRDERHIIYYIVSYKFVYYYLVFY